MDVPSHLQTEIEQLAAVHGRDRTALMPVLQELNRSHSYISEDAMMCVAKELNVPRAEVYGVATFYSFFSVAPRGKYVIRLCRTISCAVSGKYHPVVASLLDELGVAFGETTRDGLFTLEQTACIGLCDQGPAMLVNDDVHVKLTEASVRTILGEYRRKAAAEAKVKSAVPNTNADVKTAHGFVGTKLSFAGVSQDAGLKLAETMDAEGLIAKVSASGLRGRGGAGFPTGMKWKFARAEASTPKYIICNADEGEPGTFKDRLILTDFADLVCAGMAIAGKAVGAEKGIIYLRAEYAWLRAHLEDVLQRRRKAGLLGAAILGNKSFSFDIEIRMGAGAYVCGEETALIESLEGKRGEARNRMPFPVQSGYLGKPTVVNNVETFAWVPCILEKGPEWFSSMGTQKSPGARLFSVSGYCTRPGIYEYPFGTPLRQILKDAGGEGAKAVQVGGASGVCVPASQFDRKLAFEDLATGGSIIVFGPAQDMFAVAENFQHFFAEESCGQCVPCRLGNIRMFEAIERMREIGLDTQTERTLRQLATTMQTASKCGLGQSSPNAFLSILDNFAGELPPVKA